MTSVISPMGPNAHRHPDVIARKAKAQAMYEHPDRPTLVAIGEAVSRCHSVIRHWRDRGHWQRHTSVGAESLGMREPEPLRVLTPYEHGPMPRCQITGRHVNCGYFSDNDETERKAIHFGHVAREDRLEWRTKVLANRGMDLRSIARQLACTVAEVRRWMPPKGNAS